MDAFGGFTVTPLDGALVALVVFFTQAVKGHLNDRWGHLNDRWVPLVPVVLAFILTAPAVLMIQGATWLGWYVFLPQWLLESVKTFALAMSSYKIVKTTVAGQ